MTILPKPYLERDGITIYNQDCLDVLPLLGNVDLIVTDPPYNLNLFSALKMKTGSWGDVMNSAYFYAQILRLCYERTHIRQGAAWVFNSWRSLPVLQKASYDAEWMMESLLVWDKQWIGPGGTKGLRPSYELVALFCHDAFGLANRSLPDIWRHKFASQKSTGHPAEKPVALMAQILRESLVHRADAVVLDPFLGSGTTLVAAQALGCRAIGIEVEERYCELAANRLAQQGLL